MLTVALVIGALVAVSVAIGLCLRGGGRTATEAPAATPTAPRCITAAEVEASIAASGFRALTAPFGPVQIEGTPLAQTAFDTAWNDWGRGERVRDAHAAHLAELRAEHESLRAPSASASVPGDRVAAAESVIDRVIPDPSVPKGER